MQYNEIAVQFHLDTFGELYPKLEIYIITDLYINELSKIYFSENRKSSYSMHLDCGINTEVSEQN